MIKTHRKDLSRLRDLVGKRPKHIALIIALAASATVVASPPAPPSAASAAQAGSHAHRWFQIGKASWYGRAFQGKRTATGERFNMNALTCAHRTLPLGSWLRITNLRNRRSTFVRVNDRGPYQTDAIIDLSFAAAQQLHLFGKAPVRVERVSPNDPELAHALLAELTPGELPTTNLP